MRDVYGIAAFRSRQQVLRFEATLRRMGVPNRVVSTPRAIERFYSYRAEAGTCGRHAALAFM